VLALAGLIVRTILPANFEEFLRKQPPGVVWAIVGVAFFIFAVIHLAEYGAFFWLGCYWVGVGFCPR
jgi:hypothetical protein